MASKAEQRSEAMKILRNKEKYSAEEIAKAEKIISDYDAIQKNDTVGVLPKSKKKMMEKTKMAYGGMANGKKHMYLNKGAVVTDNAGLRALRASGPKGMEAYKNITGK